MYCWYYENMYIARRADIVILHDGIQSHGIRERDINLTGIFHASVVRFGATVHHRRARLKLGLIKQDYRLPPQVTR